MANSRQVLYLRRSITAALSILASIIMPVADRHRDEAHGIAPDRARAVAGLEPEPELADLVVGHVELGRHVGLTPAGGDLATRPRTGSATSRFHTSPGSQASSCTACRYRSW